MKSQSKKIMRYALIFCAILISGFQMGAWAQDFDYDTPLGKQIHRYNLSPLNQYTISAQEWGSAATGFNGLTVVAMINIPPNLHAELFNFYNKNNEKYMTIFHEQGTLSIRRYKPNNSVGNFQSYNYILYDRLFNSKYDTWEIRLYFTSNFIWIQTTPVISGQTLPSYLSPVYFGVDNMLQKNNFSDFINADDSNTRIVVGNNIINQGVRQVAVYTFQYDDLRKDIQQKFCDPFNRYVGANEEEY